MKLPQPFYRLPLELDVARLRAEAAAVPAGAWAPHPNAVPGNSSVRLISAGGGENDAVEGEMLPTVHLAGMPYVRQVLASFGVVWSRSRLMRLAPGAGVPEHSDINYHWFHRVRLHMPVTSHPDVRFHCGGECVHMAPGEVWLFDNWRAHRVENPSTEERIHLVADTSGSAAFWRFVAASVGGTVPSRRLIHDPDADARLLTERARRARIMPAAELDLLVTDLAADIAVAVEHPVHELARNYVGALEALRHDWRQLHALYGDAEQGIDEFVRLRNSVRTVTARLADGLVMRSNGVAAQRVLEARILQYLISEPVATPVSKSRRTSPHRARLNRPVFIVAAPRSGSTLLYETLAVTPQLWTLGGEAHWLIESQRDLYPGAPGIDSNRLTAELCTEERAERILAAVAERAVDADGRHLGQIDRPSLLEKTPKNALRIPFFDRLCPDARFVFLWRDPRENIASIIEAWQDGRWTTYRSLPGWDGPWSLLLPPGWQTLRGQSLASVAAYQWDTTNRVVLDDLGVLARDRWHILRYDELVESPAVAIGAVCDFLGIDFDQRLADRVSGGLPLSRYTRTAPSKDKWRRHEASIAAILPQVQSTWDRLKTGNAGNGIRSRTARSLADPGPRRAPAAQRRNSP